MSSNELVIAQVIGNLGFGGLETRLLETYSLMAEKKC